MNEEQIRRVTVQIASALLEMAASKPELIMGCTEPKLSAEDATRVRFQMTELRVALPARS
jgi:hypothetical protein